MSLKDIHTKIPSIQRFHSTPSQNTSPFALNDTNDSDAQPTVFRKPSFEYITDTDESTADGHDQLQFDEHQMPTIVNKIDQIETIQIQSQLKKFIGNEKHLILPQFMEIMKKIAPHITSNDATEMFNKVDRFHNGQIDTNVLLNNNFLARMILKLYKDDYESSVDNGDRLESDVETEFDLKYKHMNPKQLLEETIRLQKWIIDYGQPAVEKVIELEAMINIYENERNNHQLQISKQSLMMDELSTLQNQIQQSNIRSSFLMVDHRKLLLTAEQSMDEWQQQTNLINTKQKELQRYKKLSKEMSIINDKYLKKNKQLNNSNKELEEELQTLRQIVLSLENDITQLNNEYSLEREEFMNEINKLKNDLQSKTETNKTTESNDVGGISELLEANRTITIDRNVFENKDEFYKTVTNYKQDSFHRQKTLKNFYNNSIHNSNAYAPAFTSTTERDLSYEEVNDNDEQILNAPMTMIDTSESKENNLNELFRMGTSWKNFNKTVIVPNNNPNISINEQSQIFEDAINAEIKLEIKNQIKKELIDDFELKLYQKDIENKLKLNKQNQKMENEKNDLINKYESLIEKYKTETKEKEKENECVNNNSNNNNILKDRNSNKLIDTFDDEKEEIIERPQWHTKGRKSVDMRLIKKNINTNNNNNNNSNNKKVNLIEMQQIFECKLQQIFTHSTLLWTFPLIK